MNRIGLVLLALMLVLTTTAIMGVTDRNDEGLLSKQQARRIAHAFPGDDAPAHDGFHRDHRRRRDHRT